jgi:hypothetical protein
VFVFVFSFHVADLLACYVARDVDVHNTEVLAHSPINIVFDPVDLFVISPSSLSIVNICYFTHHPSIVCFDVPVNDIRLCVHAGAVQSEN